jgi:erythromycin esterase-like protein
MRPTRRDRRVAGAAVAVAVTVVGLAAGPVGAANPRPISRWVEHSAVPLESVDPAAGLDDLAPLRESIGGAAIVGLGESVHGASEELALKHRLLRFLVEDQGFRSVAWEEDWTTGVEIDTYIRTGVGDLDAIVREMSPQWQWGEVADVLRWLRDFNAGRADQVSFVGVEHYFTRLLAYDAVTAYVAQVAPEQSDELARHMRVIRPSTDDEFAYLRWYSAQPDKAPFIRHAHAVHDLVRDLAHPPDDDEHAVAVHHAHQIVSFYEHYALPPDDQNVYRDARAAENVRWWHHLRGDRIVYWGASAHTANAPQLRIVQPAEADLRYPTAGSHLRRWYGDLYLSIGVTFDHGAVSLGPDAIAELPPPEPGWFEQPLGPVRLDQFALDLRHRAPRPVREWLAAPLRTRGLADSGPGGYMAGGSLADWFDIVVHRQQVTPAAPNRE